MKSINQGVRVLLTILCLLISSSLSAQQRLLFWQDAGQSAAANSSLLPEAVSYSRAITIDAKNTARLQVGDSVVLELGPSELIAFELLSNRQYLNGDVGWHGTARIGGRLASLSLTVNEAAVLATINTGAARYTVAAEQTSASGYLGFIYTQGVGNTLNPIDDGGIPVRNPPQQSGPKAVLALSGNDVTIVQEVSSEVAVVGEQVSINIAVTNNTSGTLSGENLNVLFVLDNSELVSSSGVCTTATLGSQFSLSCSLPDIASGASTSIDYAVRLTSNSYPFIASGAFVGDVFSDQHVRDDAFVFVAMDTQSDSDGDGQSDFNENLVGTNADSSASVFAANGTVETDLMFLYTQKFVDDIGSVSPETKINQLVETTNAYYANSGVGISFRPVLYRQINHSVNNSLNTSFTALRNGEGDFSFVPATRDAVGADIVVLMDGFFQSDSACGLGSVPGVGFSGEIYHESSSNPELFVTQYTDGFPAGGGSGCDDLTLAHELGHNHGLDHSHREAGAEGTFPWALGHGIDGSFNTIMARSVDYPGSEELPLFSNPESTDCNGMPCGVSRTDLEMGADAVFTLNHTRFQIANRRASRVLPITSATGSSNLIAYGGASRSSDLSTPVSVFSANDAIDVRVTLEIPSEHQGVVGETYIVISVNGTQFYYRDSNGEYLIWDGTLESLQSSITPRALNAQEELIAFENLVPGSVGVTSAALTVFFAYAIPGTDVFVYSSNGVPLTIQP